MAHIVILVFKELERQFLVTCESYVHLNSFAPVFGAVIAK